MPNLAKRITHSVTYGITNETVPFYETELGYCEDCGAKLEDKRYVRCLPCVRILFPTHSEVKP